MQDIHNIIGTLRSGSQHSVMITSQGKQDVEKGLVKTVELKNTFVNIVGVMSNIPNKMMQLSAAAKEQAHIFEDINRQVVVC